MVGAFAADDSICRRAEFVVIGTRTNLDLLSAVSCCAGFLSVDVFRVATDSAISLFTRREHVDGYVGLNNR